MHIYWSKCSDREASKTINHDVMYSLLVNDYSTVIKQLLYLNKAVICATFIKPNVSSTLCFFASATSDATLQ